MVANSNDEAALEMVQKRSHHGFVYYRRFPILVIILGLGPAPVGTQGAAPDHGQHQLTSGTDWPVGPLSQVDARDVPASLAPRRGGQSREHFPSIAPAPFPVRVSPRAAAQFFKTRKK